MEKLYKQKKRKKLKNSHIYKADRNRNNTKKLTIQSVGEAMEQLEISDIVGKKGE